MIVLDVDTIRFRLPSYGYTPTDDDIKMIQVALETSTQRALTLTNQKSCHIPEGLKYEIIKMTVGEFLYMKKITGGLEDGSHGIGFHPRVTQFTEGDTNISATDKGKNDEAFFEDYINKLRFGDPYVLEHYRRIHW